MTRSHEPVVRAFSFEDQSAAGGRLLDHELAAGIDEPGTYEFSMRVLASSAADLFTFSLAVSGGDLTWRYTGTGAADDNLGKEAVGAIAVHDDEVAAVSIFGTLVAREPVVLRFAFGHDSSPDGPNIRRAGSHLQFHRVEDRRGLPAWLRRVFRRDAEQ